LQLPINRTTVELKHILPRTGGMPGITINRTTVELKRELECPLILAKPPY